MRPWPATTGPLLAGFLHTATAGWTIPVAVLLVITGLQCTAGWPARPGPDRARPRRGATGRDLTVPPSAAGRGTGGLIPPDQGRTESETFRKLLRQLALSGRTARG